MPIVENRRGRLSRPFFFFKVLGIIFRKVMTKTRSGRSGPGYARAARAGSNP